MEIKKVKEETNIKKFELILVDDNSTDNSHEVLKNLQHKNSFLRYFIRRKNRDLSQSCFVGFNKSLYENIIVMDGDLQHPPRYIKKLLKLYFYNKADIVIGSRNLLKKKGPGLSFFRYLSSIFIIKIINFFLDNKTSDPLSGFFVFKKKLYAKNKKNYLAEDTKF